MRILALEPYYGGSHRMFIDGWSAASRHTWTVIGLPPYKWKWRMRHGAITLADEVRQRVEAGQGWDGIFCSDMLNLAEFRGLAPKIVRDLPTVAYFHENQLTYPVRHESERDYHFVLTNLTTGLAADAVWFNSAYHRDAFLAALPAFLKRMPDYQPFDAVEAIRAKSAVWPQGIGRLEPKPSREPGPLRILWAARWEHDKNPEMFFEALRLLMDRRVTFRVSVIGEQFRDRPAVFDEARVWLGDRIDHWGYQPTQDDYEAALRETDVVVSTADHEFFGISVVEAMAAGAFPLLPRRLAYPEILSWVAGDDADRFFYDGSAEQLAKRLERLAEQSIGGSSSPRGELASKVTTLFGWPALTPRLDEAMQGLADSRPTTPDCPTLE